jgi:hypothetical protein
MVRIVLALIMYVRTWIVFRITCRVNQPASRHNRDNRQVGVQYYKCIAQKIDCKIDYVQATQITRYIVILSETAPEAVQD